MDFFLDIYPVDFEWTVHIFWLAYIHHAQKVMLLHVINRQATNYAANATNNNIVIVIVKPQLIVVVIKL